MQLRSFGLLAASTISIAIASVSPRQTLFSKASSILDVSSLTDDPAFQSDEWDMVTLTSTSTRTTTVGSASQTSCADARGVSYECGGYVFGIGLNLWWTSSYNLTVATVSVNYTQFVCSERADITRRLTIAFSPGYDNTVITADPSTYRVTNATSIYGDFNARNSLSIPGIRTDLANIEGGADSYASSAIYPATAHNVMNQTAVQSPTPWVNMPQQPLLNYAWTKFENGVPITSGIVNALQFNITTDVWTTATEYPTNPSSLFADLPQAWTSVIFDAVKTLSGIDWPLSSCTGGWLMSGAPTAHIPVAELTAYAKNTVTSTGIYAESTPAPRTTTAKSRDKASEESITPEETTSIAATFSQVSQIVAGVADNSNQGNTESLMNSRTTSLSIETTSSTPAPSDNKQTASSSITTTSVTPAPSDNSEENISSPDTASNNGKDSSDAPEPYTTGTAGTIAIDSSITPVESGGGPSSSQQGDRATGGSSSMAPTQSDNDGNGDKSGEVSYTDPSKMSSAVNEDSGGEFQSTHIEGQPTSSSSTGTESITGGFKSTSEPYVNDPFLPQSGKDRHTPTTGGQGATSSFNSGIASATQDGPALSQSSSIGLGGSTSSFHVTVIDGSSLTRDGNGDAGTTKSPALDGTFRFSDGELLTATTTIDGNEVFLLSDQTFTSGETFVTSGKTIVYEPNGGSRKVTTEEDLQTDAIAELIMYGIGASAKTSTPSSESRPSTSTPMADPSGTSQADFETNKGSPARMLVGSALGFVGLLAIAAWL